jgi:hypothetical protein
MRPDSATDHRNLFMIREFTNQETLAKPLAEFFADRKAMSFFIEPIMKTNIDAIIELAKNLNFYMSYVDKHTPIILIHSPAEEDFALHRQENLADKEFPKRAF